MTTFTTTPRSSIRWQAPAPGVNISHYLNVGSGFNLLVATNAKLIISPRRTTIWDTADKDYKVRF